ANKVAQRFGRRRGLIGIYVVLTILSLLAAAGAARSPAWFVAALLAYVFSCALNWPPLESLAASGTDDAHEISRRVGMYNLVWSGTNALTFALSGAIIAHW